MAPELGPLRFALSLSLGVLSCTSCSEDSSPPDDEDSTAATGGVGGAGGSTAGLGGAAGKGGGGATAGLGGESGAAGRGGSAGASPIRSCKTPCSTTADCEAVTLAPGANDHVCTNGGCQPTGCVSDAACEAYLTGYVCRAMGAGVPTCTPACTVAADCSLGAPPYLAENYECVDGGCLYRGCNTDMECQGTDATRACGDAGADVPTCTDRCTGTDECGIDVPWSDADNFECRGGLCHSLGCIDDTECEGIDQVCR